MELNRRDLLKTSLAGGLLGVTGLLTRASLASPALRRDYGNEQVGYGALRRRAAENTGQEILALPDGFRYTAFGATGDKMSDGHITPGAHDGMATLNHRGKIRIVRNHEVRNKPEESGAYGSLETAYDPRGGGGTTTLIVDPETRLLERDFVSLNGTIVNCAGGRTPWGTWISCEESTAGEGISQVYHKDETLGGGFARPHGYNFEVSFLDDEPVRAKPLYEMGRFVHEAIAVDPSTGIVYQTEDHKTAGFYRFIPHVYGKLAEGGKLQMAKVKGRDLVDTRKGQPKNVTYEIEWVDIKNPDPSNAWSDSLALGNQGRENGAMTFGRLEGAWYAEGAIFLNSTDGGDEGLGQVWRYTPMGESRGELTLLFESPSADVLDAPDNLCVSPKGSLVICEDGKDTQYVRGLNKDGLIFDFALNVLNGSEFCGATFSPDGRTLFVNIQTPGITLAIWGPWEQGAF